MCGVLSYRCRYVGACDKHIIDDVLLSCKIIDEVK